MKARASEEHFIQVVTYDLCVEMRMKMPEGIAGITNRPAVCNFLLFYFFQSQCDGGFNEPLERARTSLSVTRS